MRLTSFAGHFFPFLCVLCGKVVKKSHPMPRVVYNYFLLFRLKETGS